MASDYIATAVLFLIIAALRSARPCAGRPAGTNQRRIEQLDSGDIDLLVMLEPDVTPMLPLDFLLDDENRLVGRIGHPALATGASQDVMLVYAPKLIELRQDHITQSADPGRRSPIETIREEASNRGRA